MTWIGVTSSNIDALWFTPEMLSIRFKGGAIYDYPDVPEETFDELLASESVGKAFHRLIKPNFPATLRV